MKGMHENPYQSPKEAGNTSNWVWFQLWPPKWYELVVVFAIIVGAAALLIPAIYSYIP
jgi:hypothetical protein